MTDGPSYKPVIWLGSSRKDVREFPEAVQDHIGYALYVARETPHRDKELIKQRLRAAEQIAKDMKL